MLNNPLGFVDPTGHVTESEYDGTDDKLRQQQELVTLEFNATAAAAVESGQGTYADYGLGPVVTDTIEVMAGLQIVPEAPNDSLLNQIAGNISAIFSEGLEDAVTADHTPTGPEAVVWGGMQVYLYVGGLLSGSSATSLLRLGIDAAAQEAAGEVVERGTEIIDLLCQMPNWRQLSLAAYSEAVGRVLITSATQLTQIRLERGNA